MFGDIALSLAVIIIAYLLGSIPSAYIVARLMKGLDIREAGDGRLGATAVYRRAGLRGGIVVAFMDVGKGVAAVLIAQGLGLPLLVVLLAGLSAVVGHNWSIFLHFNGGKGALTTYGVLVSLMWWQFFIALALAGIAYLVTHKTGMSTGILFVCLSLITWFTTSLVLLGSLLPLGDEIVLSDKILLSIFPLFIGIPMVVKHITMPKTSATVVASAKRRGNREG